jgi:hypothetical protein
MLLGGQKCPFHHCLRGMIPSHGVNSDIHDEAIKLASERTIKRAPGHERTLLIQ